MGQRLDRAGVCVVADMKIREGAYYRTFGGEIAGPMKRSEVSPTEWLSGRRGHWTDFGCYCHSTAPEDVWDLVSEVYVSDTPPETAPAPETKTLRDEFAMVALSDFMSQFRKNVVSQYAACRLSYDWADAMMEARKK